MEARLLLGEVVRADLPPIPDTTPLKYVQGLDSIGMVNLVLQVETVLGRQLTEAELEGLVTVGDLQRLLGPR
jgi:acyl carrier protein